MAHFALTDAERKHLAQVIKEIELKTSGELRMVIVRRSTPQGPVIAETWMILIIATLLMLLAFRLELALDLRWWWILAAMALTFPVAWMLAQWRWLQRRLLTEDEIGHSVATRAELEFYREGLGRTKDQTGVLLFLSLFEKRAVVLGDRGINQKIVPGLWDEVIGLITSSGRDGKWCEHLEQALRTCGALLIEHFPAELSNRDELSNEIVIKD